MFTLKPISFAPPVLLRSILSLIGGFLALLAFAFSPATARAQTAGSLTPEDSRKLTEGIKPLVNQSTDGLVEVRRPDGSVSMNLQGRFQSVSVARKEANGTVTQSCVDNVAAATAFFKAKQQALETGKASVTPNDKASRKQARNR